MELLNPSEQQANTKESKYWAAKADPNEVAGKLINKGTRYYEHLKKYGRLATIIRLYNAYYRGLLQGGELGTTGDQNELTTVFINHLRNLLQHLLVMTTAQRPSFEPQASNTDKKSQSQTILANGLLEYDMREKRLERLLKRATEYSLTGGEGFIDASWNQSAGEEYGVDPETHTIVKDGAIDYRCYGTLDLIRDVTKTSGNDHSWYIVRTVANKYDLMARYPDLEQQIERIAPAVYDGNNPRLGGVAIQEEETDDVYRYDFFHAKTDSLPNGRHLSYLAADCVLRDGALPYRRPHVYRITGSEQLDTGWGYTIAFDLIQPQRVVDALYSTVATNQSHFGVQNILVPEGANIALKALTGAVNVVTYRGPQKPEPLNLTSTPAEIFKMLEMVERVMETLSGVNSVARGDPQSSLKSGAALALVQSMALQFNSDLQESYVNLLEDVGTATIELYREFAKTPRIAMIAGKANRAAMKDWTGDDLSLINRVHVNAGNALSRTVSGRVQIAEWMGDRQMLKTPDELNQVLTTGRLEPAIEGVQAELLNIRSENERLSEGKKPVAVATDNHPQHIQEHSAVIASPEAREDPAIITNTLGHMQEHSDLWVQVAQTNPSWLAARNIPPPPMPQMPPGPPSMAPPPAPGDTTGTPPPEPGGPSLSSLMNPSQPVPALPSSPTMPQNALTGETAMVPGVNA